MSRAAKMFLGSSIVATTVTVWGVHYLQKSESDRMYQGVIRDEQRLLARASTLLPSALQPASASASTSAAPAHPRLQTGTSSARDPAYPINYSTPAHSSATPLNTPSSPVQQPAPVVDPDCVTCQLSPPPEISEKSTKEERARERQARLKEYEDQKGLGERLEKEQGIAQRSSGRSEGYREQE